MQTINAMRKSSHGKNVEIVNYHYARFVFDPEELDQYDQVGVDFVKDFIDSIKCDRIKEEIGVHFAAQKTGDKKNVILVTGIGALYESLPNEFFEVLDLPEYLKKHVDAKAKKKLAPTAPVAVMKPAADILDEERKAPVTQPRKVEKTEKPAVTVPTITAPKKTIQKVDTKENNRAKEPSDGASYIKKYMDDENFAERPDLIKKLMKDKGMKKTDAEAAIDEMIETFGDIKKDGEMIYKD